VEKKNKLDSEEHGKEPKKQDVRVHPREKAVV